MAVVGYSREKRTSTSNKWFELILLGALRLTEIALTLVAVGFFHDEWLLEWNVGFRCASFSGWNKFKSEMCKWASCAYPKCIDNQIYGTKMHSPCRGKQTPSENPIYYVSNLEFELRKERPMELIACMRQRCRLVKMQQHRILDAIPVLHMNLFQSYQLLYFPVILYHSHTHTWTRQGYEFDILQRFRWWDWLCMLNVFVPFGILCIPQRMQIMLCALYHVGVANTEKLRRKVSPNLLSFALKMS